MAAEDNHNEITLRGVILFKAALLGNKQKILGQSPKYWNIVTYTTKNL